MKLDAAMLIMNPNAGQGYYTQALRRLARQCHELDVREPRDHRDAYAFAAEAVEKGYELVIAAGGDGTIHHVVNGLEADFGRCALAVLPIGSANDFAKSLEIPLELEDAFDLLHDGVETPVDLVHADGQGAGNFYLMNAATGGFSQLVNEKLNAETKSLWGSLAYFRAAVEAFPEFHPFDIAAEIDGSLQMINTGALVVANGRFAGGVELMPGARINDGKLDIMAVIAETLAERTQLMAEFAMGQHLEGEYCIYYRAQRIHIQANPAMQFSSDGEDMGHTPVAFEVVPHALRVLTPEALT